MKSTHTPTTRKVKAWAVEPVVTQWGIVHLKNPVTDITLDGKYKGTTFEDKKTAEKVAAHMTYDKRVPYIVIPVEIHYKLPPHTK